MRSTCVLLRTERYESRVTCSLHRRVLEVLNVLDVFAPTMTDRQPYWGPGQSPADVSVQVVAVRENGGAISDDSDVEFVGEWQTEPTTAAACSLIEPDTMMLSERPSTSGPDARLASAQLQPGRRRRRSTAQATAIRTVPPEHGPGMAPGGNRRQRTVYQRIYRRLRELAGNRREVSSSRRNDSVIALPSSATFLESLEPFFSGEGWTLETLTSIPLSTDALDATVEPTWSPASAALDEHNRSSSTNNNNNNAIAPWNGNSTRRVVRSGRSSRRTSRQQHWAVAMLNSFLQPSFDSLPSPRPNPCPRALVELLPLQTATEREESDACPICLSNYERGERLRRLPCLHLFHRTCIDRWFSKQNSCPVDKMSVADGFTDECAQSKLQALGVSNDEATACSSGVFHPGVEAPSDTVEALMSPPRRRQRVRQRRLS